MLRALVRLFAYGHRPRFADWPDPPADLPALDLPAHALGPLAFGAPLDDARALGRPDRHERIASHTSQLLYAHLGLVLEFDDHAGLDYVAFLVAPDPHDPEHPRLRHCSPRLASGHALTPTTTESDLRHLFGAPTDVDRDENETVAYHLAHGLRIECELCSDGTLKRLNLYPHEED